MMPTRMARYPGESSRKRLLGVSLVLGLLSGVLCSLGHSTVCIAHVVNSLDIETCTVI